MVHKYYQTMGELIDHYVPFDDNEHYVPFDDNEPYVQALIHAYELGAMHYSEEEEVGMGGYELAEFDSNWEQEEAKEQG